MTQDELKALIEDLRLNHEYCTKEIILQAADELERLAQRTWVGLTDEEIEEGIKQSWVTEQAFQSAAWWAEAKLKEKNGFAEEKI
jgi:hypothetical protein